MVSEKIFTEDQFAAAVFNEFSIDFVPNLKTSTDHGYDHGFMATDDHVTTLSISLGIIQVSL